ncbi:hypothetical protein BCIN_06g01200 [Botrytis cinerea B05.10]|uniref:Uncharacterized protein n=1 Tax=Botryotinia fuckeliana (strain B05.10) TaxID=332648 RepID=A0A384JJU8_BOTFB|nr:hypothetical protein BCIN_06g01200 [Botrytis cinerea B05.10]ATZ50624.1 hypothetical protein BCIN_06g01200 [Botrytis cinerea B05.10]
MSAPPAKFDAEKADNFEDVSCPPLLRNNLQSKLFNICPHTGQSLKKSADPLSDSQKSTTRSMNI